MGSVLARRAAVDAVGGWEDAFPDICDDQVFHAKMALRHPILVVDGCWDRYRQHDASVCHTEGRAGRLDAHFDRYLSWLEGHVAGQHVTDADLLAALRDAMLRHRHPWLHRLKRRAGRHVWRVRRAWAELA
jgi:hypothetical protein